MRGIYLDKKNKRYLLITSPREKTPILPQPPPISRSKSSSLVPYSYLFSITTFQAPYHLYCYQVEQTPTGNKRNEPLQSNNLPPKQSKRQTVARLRVAGSTPANSWQMGKISASRKHARVGHYRKTRRTGCTPDRL